MNDCPCDDFEFPPPVVIPPGLWSLPRQTGTFADFRAALLRAASVRGSATLETHPLWRERFLTEADRAGLMKSLAAFGQWRGRHPQDFGVMLIEMWAYLCDVLSFYDEAIAQEGFIRTARRRDSVRKLIGLLGYVPRPAVGALVELAAFAEGRRAVTLPGGTAFRSGAFAGHPPQVFEMTEPATIHPFSNEWRLLPVRRDTFGNAEYLLCRPGTVAVKPGDVALIDMGDVRAPRIVNAVSDYVGSDGEKYVKVAFEGTFPIPANTPVSKVRLLKPTGTAGLWPLPLDSEPAFSALTYLAYLDSVRSAIRAGQDVVFQEDKTLHWARVLSTTQEERTFQIITFPVAAPAAPKSSGTGKALVKSKKASSSASSSIPPVTSQVTRLSLHIVGSWEPASTTDVAVHYGFIAAGEVTVEALTELHPTDTLCARTPLEHPSDAAAPARFQLEDKNNTGVGIAARLDYAKGVFSPGQEGWSPPLVAPVRAFGNIITASRGETVNGEFLGIGDAAQMNQRFKLKKSPLTYLPEATPENPSGQASTLTIHVDRLRWREVPSFFRAGDHDEVYLVRQNDAGESVVTFGDGVRGRRLRTGAQVVANYRFGAGAAMPLTGSIKQLAKPAPGLKGIRNPVAAYGGDDAEPAEKMRKYAPRSALLLGRAVSIPDFKAATASVSGVRAVSAEWRWDRQHQRPVVKIWHLGDAKLGSLISQKLRALTEPDTPIEVIPATPLPRVLAIQMPLDPRRSADTVLAAVRAALMDVESGLLAPERLGIGKPFFRSVLFEFLLRVEGVQSVTGVTIAEAPFAMFGVTPGAGNYFDFTGPGALLLNGKAAS